jgi:hypothetical protein
MYSIQLFIVYNRVNVLFDGVKTPKYIYIYNTMQNVKII